MRRQSEAVKRYGSWGYDRVLVAGASTMLLVVLGAPAQAQEQGEREIVETMDDESTDRPWIEGVPHERRMKAYELFLAGNELMKEALFAKGAEKYKAALELWDHPAFHYNLGVAQMNLDQIIEAYRSFERSRHHGPRPIGQEKYEQAQYYLNVFGKQLAEVEVRCDEPGAAVALDGRALFIGPGRERAIVRPGGHRVEATKARRLPDAKQIVLDPGDKLQVTLTPQLPEYLATERRWPQWIPWAVVGAGTVVLAGGGYLDLESSKAFDEYDRELDGRCTGSKGCPRDSVPDTLRVKLDAAENQQWGARAVYAVGSITVVTGAVLLYMNRERLVPRRGTVEGPQMTFMPVLAPNTAGVSASLRF